MPSAEVWFLGRLLREMTEGHVTKSNLRLTHQRAELAYRSGCVLVLSPLMTTTYPVEPASAFSVSCASRAVRHSWLVAEELAAATLPGRNHPAGSFVAAS